MKKILYLGISLLGLIITTSFLISGMMLVPFHPDESSLLYQSRDFEALLSNPRSLAWNPTMSDDYDQEYRALNAPLGKYIIGLGRRLVGYEASDVSTDWNWGKTWDENAVAGALPERQLLWGGRLAVTLLLPVSIILIYFIGSRLSGKLCGFLAAAFLASNALILLHNRRSMSEGALTFGVCLAIIGLLHADKHPWLAGLGSSLALSAKYSTAPLLPLSLLACLWISENQDDRSAKWRSNILSFLSVTVIVLLLLHPFLWSNPLQAAGKIWQARQDLLRDQIETLRAFVPDQILDTIPKRVFLLIGHLFITPPQFAEVGNYLADTAEMETIYLANPLHRLFRGNVGGGLMLMWTLFGMIVGLYQLARVQGLPRRRGLILIMIATILQALALLIANPLPIQRYYMPLVPFICLWAAYGIAAVIHKRNQAAVERAA